MKLPSRRTAFIFAAVAAMLLAFGLGTAAASNGFTPITRDCSGSDLPTHTGFQVAPACVTTEFGEVTKLEDNPQLLITDAPKNVQVGEDITLKVSTRNLIRDRFPPAAEGGYYREAATVTANDITHGHFHVACRLLDSTNVAPQPARNESFKAVEDGGGGATPDTVTVTVPGLNQRGTAQCAAWAGDGSHRIAMTQFANETPPFDAVRIHVVGNEHGH